MIVRCRRIFGLCSGNDRGSALVELAIILPFFMLLVFGAVEFARAISTYGQLVNQTRIAARYLAARVPGRGHAEAKCMAVYGVASVTCSGTPLVVGLATDQVSVVDASTAADHRVQATGGSGSVAVNLVTVRISGYSHRLIVSGFLPDILGGATAITFDPIALTMRQQL